MSIWNIFGHPNGTLAPTPAQLANNPHSQASMSINQLASMAQQQFGTAYNAYAQQAQNNLYNQQALASIKHQASQAAAWGAQQHAAWIEKRYMIDGQYMTLQEFMDFIWPEDCPDKTFFALKHTKEDNNEQP